MEELVTGEKNVDETSIAFARGFIKLSEKDKKEIINLREYKYILKEKRKEK